MEIKTALEVIIADLDDVQKLIANLKRIEQVPRLEIELCLSKCRNIQEIMQLMKELELQSAEEKEKVEEAEKGQMAEDGRLKEEEAEEGQMAEGGRLKEEEAEEGQMAEGGRLKEEVDNETKDSFGKDKEEKTHKGPGKQVIGERFAPREGRNESLAKGMPVINLSAKLMEKPIADIGKAIGINDRFTYIRELFQGDAGKYKETIDHLNTLTSWEDALLYINENFKWDYEDETTRQLLVTIKRKLFVYE